MYTSVMETRGILGRLADNMAQILGLGLLLGLGFALWQIGADGRAALWSGIWRSIVWVVIVLAAPWGARPVMKRLMEAGTNWAGAGAVAALVLVDLIAAVLLMTVWPASFWAWVASLAALAIAGTYNYLVLEYLSEQTGL